MRTGALLTRLIRARTPAALSLISLAGVCAAIFSILVITASSADRATAQSVLANNAGHQFTLQAVDPAAIELLADRPETYPVWDRQGSVSTPLRTVPITVRFSTPDAVPGTFVGGRAPEKAGEIALTDTAMNSLEVSIGSRVALSINHDAPEYYAVVGRLVNTAQKNAIEAVAVKDLDQASAVTWLTSVNPLADPQLKEALVARKIAFRSMASLIADQHDSPVSSLASSIRVAALVVTVGAPLLLALAFLVYRRGNTNSVVALAAGGIPKRRGWALFGTAAVIVSAAGAALGAATAIAITTSFHVQLSGLLDQRWTAIAVNWSQLVLFVLLLPAGAMVATLVFAAAALLHIPRLRLPSGSRIVAPALLVAAVVVWALMWARQVSAVGTSAVAVVFTIAGVVFVRRMSIWRASAATSRTIAVLGQVVTIVGVALAIIILTTGTYAADQVNRSRLSEASFVPLQPAGSYLVLGASAGQSDEIQDSFEALGGRDVRRYLVPDESTHTVRVTNPGTIYCFQDRQVQNPGDVLADCGPTATSAPINAVLLNTAPADTVWADPGLVEDGKVGVLDYDVDSGDVTYSGVEAAEAAIGLGGNMPGAVVPADSALASRFQLRPSGFELIALVDFSTLPDSGKAQIRSLVTRIAPTAQVVEDRGFDDSGRRSIGQMVAIAGSVLAAVLALAAIFNVMASHREFRQSLADLGARRKFRYSLAGRLLLPALAAPAIAGVAIAINAWFLAGGSSAYTLIWLAPVLLPLLILVIAAASYARRPAL